MAYFRRRYRRLQKRRRRFYRRVPMARRVRRITYGIAERKYRDFDVYPFEADYKPYMDQEWSATTLPFNWQWFNITGAVNQGVGRDQRVGSRFFVRYIQMSIRIMISNVTPMNLNYFGCICRYVVANVRNNNRKSAPYAEYFKPVVSPACNVFGFRESSSLGNFKTLLDRQHIAYLTSAGGSDSDRSTNGTAVIQHYIPVFKEYENLNTGTQTVSDFAGFPGNALMVGWSCSMPDCCVVGCSFRVCFSDA